ncbi:hypothetical protein [Halomonas stenophila]|uniref:Uncharacterized protein n=1 Tax=Halomonas stenophila TaxID=795312 RepID=A0A7W5ES14_9GAMM|nr:hypothetical protein [Halomonas stenophila]MBB3230226.1 hypothetical protein [Halomonas stenophila]
MFSATFYPAEIGREVLGGYRDFTEQAPESVSSFAICGTIPEEPDYPQAAHGKPYVLLAACYAGDPAEGERVTAPLRGLGEPLTDFSGVMPFVEVQQLLDGDYPQGRHYYWKSRYLRRFDDAAIERLLELAAERPSALSTVDVWHLGGAMARQDGGPTAFETRDAPFLLGVESNWDEPGDSATNIAWTREACERFAPFSDERGYLNFGPARTGPILTSPLPRVSRADRRRCRRAA